MLLVGYIEKHKDTCAEDDCPLRLRTLGRRKFVNDDKPHNSKIQCSR